MASLKQRGSVYYIQFYVGANQRRISTGTDSYQLAWEKLRQFELAQHRGDDNPLPTRTPIADIVSAYVAHIRMKRPPKPGQDRRFKAAVIEPQCFESITTADIATFISSRMQSRGLPTSI